MSINKITNRNLWCSAFNAESIENNKIHCDRLTAELWKFREKVSILVGRISSVLPGLTVHDVSHLDALWEVADIIAGEDYPLNPLEAFILGGAILLHDSAMCWEAYSNGKDGVRKTVEWKDAYAVERERQVDLDDKEIRSIADFSALRSLHAHEAAYLAIKEWIHPDSKQAIFLIDDSEIRNHLGSIIGKIASSHHWNIDVLSSRLGDQFNAPAFFPSQWSVDPVKIACLLRCADAAHVNQARAPDFLYALVRRSGISRLHWQAQNKMMGPTLDAGDRLNETIMYTSSVAYNVNESNAWWISYDAISVIDKEIKTSNSLLLSRARQISAPEFKVKKVKAANSPEDISRLLQVENWAPCNAQIHVSNIELLIKNLGGEKLYGEGTNKLEVVLRELIQNSRDAIMARRFVDKNSVGIVAIKVENVGDEFWLSIEDDGLGMSYNVLTGSLLDFGTSFWKTALLQDEFPGLRSSKFKSIGRFGIGFYSIFMIADSVSVTSRRWDKGLDEANTLFFENGLTFRPVVQSGRTAYLGSRTSTNVRIKLKKGLINNDEVFDIASNQFGIPSIKPFLKDYISAIAIGLDVNISYESENFKKEIIHEYYNNSKKILSDLSFSIYQNEEDCISYIENNHKRLRYIYSDGVVVGCAAISTDVRSRQFRLGTRTIGGLSSSVVGGNLNEYIGYINHKPGSARRESAKIDVPDNIMNEWYEEQIAILSAMEFNDAERNVVASHACSLGFDPILYGRVLLSFPNGGIGYFTYDDVCLMAEEKEIVILKSIHMAHAETHHQVFHHKEKIMIFPIANSSYLSLDFEDGLPKVKYSLIDCLGRTAIAKGKNPTWRVVPSTYKSFFGAMEELIFSVS